MVFISLNNQLLPHLCDLASSRRACDPPPAAQRSRQAPACPSDDHAGTDCYRGDVPTICCSSQPRIAHGHRRTGWPRTGTARGHRSTEGLGWEGTSGGHLVQPHAQAGPPRAGCPGPHPDGIRIYGDSTTSLGNLFQGSVILEIANVQQLLRHEKCQH